MFQKIKPFRNKKYLAWLREQPCCGCFNDSGCDAHHVTGLNSGMGTKNSDMTCISLCRECHTLLHSGNKQVDEYYHLARIIQKASDTGVVDVI